MNDLLIQRTRYVLRSRFRRAQTSPFELFSSSCIQLINWLYNYPILSELCKNLEYKYQELLIKKYKIIDDTFDAKNSYTPEIIKANNIEEHSAICLFIIKAITKINDNEINIQRFQLSCMAESMTGEEYNYDEIEDVLEILKDVALDSIFEYLDEKLDDRNAIFGLLYKYKQLSEWFNKEELSSIAENGYNNKKGELALVINLHKFIMEQGLEFVIEPSSTSGEVDLILRDPNGTYLILDAKYINNSLTDNEIKKKVAKGFHQVMKYCEDYNESTGFLVTFNNTDKRIELDIDDIDGLPFFKIGSKNIFHIFINLKLEPSASKLGIAKELLIDRTELKVQL